MTVAVLADIVGSRRLPDRVAAQRVLDEVIATVERELPASLQPIHPLRPTTGDEQQAVFATLEAALAFILQLQLTLPDGLEFRFGIGIGPIGAVASSSGDLMDGPGWWAARAAIDVVHAKQQRTIPSTRSWIVGAPEEDVTMHAIVAFANAYLLTRDELVGAMNERARRLTSGRLRGLTQRELAHAEGITQPAVSQALSSAGAASIIEGYRAITTALVHSLETPLKSEARR